jgi:hypothetical protein
MSRTVRRRTRLGHLAAALLLALSALAGLPLASGAASTINVGPAVAIDSTDGTCSLMEAFVLIDALQAGSSASNDCGDSSTLSWPVTVALTSNHTYTITSVFRPLIDPATAFPELTGSTTQVIV